MKAHAVVKLGATKYRGLRGVVESVAEGVAQVRVEGVVRGVSVKEVVAVNVEKLKVVG
jgi:hypothetical protein